MPSIASVVGDLGQPLEHIRSSAGDEDDPDAEYSTINLEGAIQRATYRDSADDVSQVRAKPPSDMSPIPEDTHPLAKATLRDVV